MQPDKSGLFRKLTTNHPAFWQLFFRACNPQPQRRNRRRCAAASFGSRPPRRPSAHFDRKRTVPASVCRHCRRHGCGGGSARVGAVASVAAATAAFCLARSRGCTSVSPKQAIATALATALCIDSCVPLSELQSDTSQDLKLLTGQRPARWSTIRQKRRWPVSRLDKRPRFELQGNR